MEQVINQMPRIGDIAPDFEVITTTGMLKLSEYNKDNWLITRCTVRNVEKNKSKKVAHLTEIQFIKIEFLHKFYLNYDAQLSGSSK